MAFSQLPPNFAEVFLESQGQKDARPKLAPDIEAIRLRDSYRQLNERHIFRPGQIVRRKAQATDSLPFGDNDLAIVIEVSDPIIADYDDPTSNNYRRRVDMIVGCIIQHEDGCDMLPFFHVDSRRVEPHPDFQDDDDGS